MLFSEYNFFKLNFIDPASPLMYGIIELHDHIFFFLNMILFLVLFLLATTLRYFTYNSNSALNKYLLTQSVRQYYSWARLNSGISIEIIWTVIPSLILVLIAIPSFALLYATDELVDPSITIQVIGHQWYRSYEYNDLIAIETLTAAPGNFLNEADSLINELAHKNKEVPVDDFTDMFILSAKNKLGSLPKFYVNTKPKFAPSNLFPDFLYEKNCATWLKHKDILKILPRDNECAIFDRNPLPYYYNSYNIDVVRILPRITLPQYSLPKDLIFNQAPVARPFWLAEKIDIKELFKSSFKNYTSMPSWSVDYFKINDYFSFLPRVTSSNYSAGSIEFDSYMRQESDLNLGELRLYETDFPLVLPKFTHIRSMITADDVIHSWSVPALGIKVDAVPGRLNHAHTYIKYSGVFYGQCSESCGVNHAFTPIQILVFEPQLYYDYIRLLLLAK